MRKSESGLVRAVRLEIRQDEVGALLGRGRQRNSVSPYAGYCYVASEALYHLLWMMDVPGSTGYKPMYLRVNGDSHWFLSAPDGRVVDPTADQFLSPPDYRQAKGKGFLTKHPSRRAQELIRRVCETTSSSVRFIDRRRRSGGQASQR